MNIARQRGGRWTEFRLKLDIAAMSFRNAIVVLLANSGPGGSEFGMTVITTADFRPHTAKRDAYDRVSFHRTELSVILAVYGRMVAAGEWKDYSIDFLRDVAIFSVFRRATEHPLYRIEKRPKLAQRQGAYAVLGPDGRVEKRGKDLAQVMRVFDAKLLKVID